MRCPDEHRRLRFFSPLLPTFHVLPLRVRLGLAYPTGLNALRGRKMLTDFRLAFTQPKSY
jgi:hypothetical protein